jgi:hypothetical protein
MVHRPGYHGATMGTEAVRFLVLWTAGWIHSRQLEAIEFLREENRVLREQLGGRKLRFTDDQRRRLAVKGRLVGRHRLGEFAGLVTPDTILRWARRPPLRPLALGDLDREVVPTAHPRTRSRFLTAVAPRHRSRQTRACCPPWTSAR